MSFNLRNGIVLKLSSGLVYIMSEICENKESGSVSSIWVILIFKVVHLTFSTWTLFE